MDQNEAALTELMEDAKWVERHLGKWVSIINGKLEGSNDSKIVVERRMARRHPQKPYLLKFIEA